MNKVTHQGLPPDFIMTGDGSVTLFDRKTGEHYHSIFGAVAESRHIFTGAGLHFVSGNKTVIRLLEVGFGTGLNALLSFYTSKDLKIRLIYTAIESNALSESNWSLLNYPGILGYGDAGQIFRWLHQSPWGIKTDMNDLFSILKIHSTLESFEPDAAEFDLVYFDAFSPDVQPEMWTCEVFEKMAYSLVNQGVLVTYSTKGLVKRNLKEAGFSIEKLPGPPGKREILRAVKL